MPREVLMEDGSVCKDKNKVLDRWADAFQKLLNEGNANVDNSDLLLNDDDNDNLCDQITLDEVKNAVNSMQNGKARGIDEIPMEVLRNRNVTKFMCAFFNKCFKDRSVPKVWLKGIISPIPKDKSKDLREPMNYRGITLTCIMYKVFCNILNCRLSKWAELNHKIPDEQNGFRARRSCADHLLSLTSIVQARISAKKRHLCGIRRLF